MVPIQVGRWQVELGTAGRRLANRDTQVFGGEITDRFMTQLVDGGNEVRIERRVAPIVGFEFGKSLVE